MFILENIKTGQTIERQENTGTLEPGWRVKQFIPDSNKRREENKIALAIWATKLGLPVANFLQLARWLLDKDCPYCEMGGKVLNKIKELGEDKAHDALVKILAAKDRNDLAALEEIRKSLWSSESPELPPQS